MNLDLCYVDPSPERWEMIKRAASLADAMMENLSDSMFEMAAEEPQDVKDTACMMVAQALMFHQAVKGKPEKQH